MVFIETPIFTKRVQQLLPDTHYTKLQQAILQQPDIGSIIPRSGGIRKLRWRLPDGGKRGGLRVVYYWDTPDDVIYMLLVYKKNKQEDLTPNQLKALRGVMEDYLK
ncbi:MAG: hypothetical protein AAF639_09975 [Chloroflexota bacterium]